MQVVLPARDFTQRDKRHAAGTVTVACIELMRDFMNNQIKTGSIEGVLNIEPVEHDGPLLPALAGLNHPLAVYQPDIVLPFVVDNKRSRVDENFMETVKPF